MTQHEALDRLIEAVEAGSLQWRDTETTPGMFNAWRAYHGSLDAAKALHDALLPGWAWDIQPGFVSVFDPDDDFDFQTGRGGDNTAQVWLLATLRAYRSTLPKDTP